MQKIQTIENCDGANEPITFHWNLFSFFFFFAFIQNGVISFEMDKIDKAQTILKLLEKRCTASSALGSHSSALVNNRFAVNSFNWLSNVRYKIFGNVASLNVDGEKVAAAPKTPAQLIEEQIILADVYMSLAILTFLTQDITGWVHADELLSDNRMPTYVPTWST